MRQQECEESRVSPRAEWTETTSKYKLGSWKTTTTTKQKTLTNKIPRKAEIASALVRGPSYAQCPVPSGLRCRYRCGGICPHLWRKESNLGQGSLHRSHSSENAGVPEVPTGWGTRAGSGNPTLPRGGSLMASTQHPGVRPWCQGANQTGGMQQICIKLVKLNQSQSLKVPNLKIHLSIIYLLVKLSIMPFKILNQEPQWETFYLISTYTNTQTHTHTLSPKIKVQWKNIYPSNVIFCFSILVYENSIVTH